MELASIARASWGRSGPGIIGTDFGHIGTMSIFS
jgi:hypothetical protein